MIALWDVADISPNVSGEDNSPTALGYADNVLVVGTVVTAAMLSMNPISANLNLHLAVKKHSTYLR